MSHSRFFPCGLHVCGWVRIRTARHVVFDEEEAEHTTCRFFYDNKDSPLITLNCWTVEKADTDDDLCELECATCEEGLLDELEKLCTEWTESYEKVHRKYMSSRDDSKWTFMVSHPHGCPKQVSVGKWLDRYITKNNSCRYTYNTSTCPGSSGACVHSLGYNHYYRALHVHSGVNSHDRNWSGSAQGLVYEPAEPEEDYSVFPVTYQSIRLRLPDGTFEYLGNILKRNK